MCVALDTSGAAVTSTNPTGGATTWTPATVDAGHQLTAISCPSTSLCVAGDDVGNAVVGTLAQHLLTATKAGFGSGTVTSSDGQMNCGTACQHAFSAGTSVTLTAAATTGSTFAGWSGGGCSGTGTCAVTMSSDQAVTATFTITPTPSRTLTVSVAGSGSGTVTAAGVNCPGVCSHSYANGAIVTLTATAKPGSRFAGWSGAAYSATGTCTMTMNSDQTLTATFTATPNPTAPTITAFKLTNTRFIVAAQPTAINAKAKTPRGSAFLYTISKASTATIVIERQTPGRLVGKKCVAQTKANAKKKRCTITKRVGTLTRKSKAGSNTIAFSGRIGRTALTPATYRATITARDGNSPISKPRSAAFTIVRS